MAEQQCYHPHLYSPHFVSPVDYTGNLNDDEKAARIEQALYSNKAYWAMAALIKDRVAQRLKQQEGGSSDAEAMVLQELHQSGYHKELLSLLSSLHSKAEAKQRVGAMNGALPAELRCLYPELDHKEHDQEPLDHVRAACRDWERSINDEVILMSQEMGQPFARRRRRVEDRLDGNEGGFRDPPVPSSSSISSASSSSAMGRSPKASTAAGGGGGGRSSSLPAGSGGTSGKGRPDLGFLFDSADLLEAIGGIRSPNRSKAFLQMGGGDASWGHLGIQLKTPTLEELQVKFRDLSPQHRQVGLDGERGRPRAQDSGGGASSGATSTAGGSGRGGGLNSGTSNNNSNNNNDESTMRFVLEGREQSEAVLESAQVHRARQLARRGLPTALRPRLWRLMLGLPQGTTQEEVQYMDKLRADVDSFELVTDSLYELDIQFIIDDDMYFPFEEVLRHVLMALARDTYVLRSSLVRVHQPILGHACEGQTPGTAVPPCGVQPFRGMVSYAAPLCFLFEEEVPVYFVLRAMYCRYWCKLNAIRSAPDGLVYLLKLFEDLLQRHSPCLVLSLLNIGVQPLSIAMRWIQFGFAGFLQVDQVLLLWDRLLGYDSLTLLPVLSAAIFVFRAESLLSAEGPEEVLDVLGDGSRLKVVPLLQSFIFAGW